MHCLTSLKKWECSTLFNKLFRCTPFRNLVDLVSFDRGLEDEDAGVEAVGPAGVRRRRKLVTVKKLVAVLQDLEKSGLNGFMSNSQLVVNTDKETQGLI